MIQQQNKDRTTTAPKGNIMININDLESLKTELNKRVHIMCETAPVDAGERLMNVIDRFIVVNK